MRGQDSSGDARRRPTLSKWANSGSDGATWAEDRYEQPHMLHTVPAAGGTGHEASVDVHDHHEVTTYTVGKFKDRGRAQRASEAMLNRSDARGQYDPSVAKYESFRDAKLPRHIQDQL